MKRTAAAFVIDRNNTVAEYTRPELAFCEMFGHRVVKPLPITVAIDEDGSEKKLMPDFHFVNTNVLVAVDGPYHRSEIQQRKTRRQDEAMNAKGFRILHIDTELLMAKKHHDYVRQATEDFLLGTALSKRLAA